MFVCSEQTQLVPYHEKKRKNKRVLIKAPLTGLL